MSDYLGLERNAAYYDKFLSPADSKYGVFEVTLFARRVWHLLSHREWLDDAILVKKFKAQLGETKPADIATSYIFDQFLRRVTPDKRAILDSLKPLRFSSNLWDAARSGERLSDQQIISLQKENSSFLDKRLQLELIAHLQRLKMENTDRNRIALKNWMIGIESPNFKREVINMINDIYRGASSPNELKIQTRILRSFLDKWGYDVGGRDGTGHIRTVFDALIEMLKPDFSRPSVTLFAQNIQLQDGLLFLPQVFRGGRKGENQWLAAVFLCEPPLTPLQKHHMVPYVFDGTHYVSLDNMQNEKKKLTAEELKNKMAKVEVDPINSQAIAFPPTFRPIPPDSTSWTIPRWERNNCFFVSSLVQLAVYKYYMQL